MHSFLLLFLLGGLGGSSEFLTELANEDLGEGDELLRLDLVVVVAVDGAEHGVDVFVGNGHADVVATEELVEELAQLASVEPRVAIIVVVIEVSSHLSRELGIVAGESVQLGLGSLKLACVKVAWVNHFFLLYLLSSD